MGECLAKYKATNLETGEVFEWTSRELIERLGTSRTVIYQYAASGNAYNKKWLIERIESDGTGKRPIPMEILYEWDQVTQPFKELARKRRKP